MIVDLEVDGQFVFHLHWYAITHARLPFRHARHHADGFLGKQLEHFFAGATLLIASQSLERLAVFHRDAVLRYAHIADRPIRVHHELHNGLSFQSVVASCTWVVDVAAQIHHHRIVAAGERRLAGTARTWNLHSRVVEVFQPFGQLFYLHGGEQDLSFGVQHDHRWYPLDAEGLSRQRFLHLLHLAELQTLHATLGDVVPPLLAIGVVRDVDEHQAVVGILFLQLHHLWHILSAVGTPRSPEVQYDISAAQVVQAGVRCTVNHKVGSLHATFQHLLRIERVEVLCHCRHHSPATQQDANHLKNRKSFHILLLIFLLLTLTCRDAACRVTGPRIAKPKTRHAASLHFHGQMSLYALSLPFLSFYALSFPTSNTWSQ